ncbi:MAG: sulfatase-like hydrolase/transferase [Anaerolineales bacterium]|nr:sulfatase-like hydrolase/transferase [Anaerolineales bacterium]
MVTKPSSLSLIGFPKKVEVFLFTGSLVAGGSCLILLVLLVIGLLPVINKHQKLMRGFGALLPAGILTCTILLLVDNFSYTMFDYGIVSTDGIIRGLYALGFMIIFFLCSRHFYKKFYISDKNIDQERSPRIINIFMAGVILLSLIIPVLKNDFGNQSKSNAFNQIENKPHIIMITADGVNATSMSVYGYERDTSPRMKALAETSLVADNAFTNSGNTSGSIISIYTSKYPTKTGILYPPNILRDDDAYQHLPGVLWAQGYYTVQMTVPHYGDAYTLNLLNGFDKANGREIAVSSVLMSISGYMPTDFSYFIYEIGNRLIDRLRHIFFIKIMTNPMDLVMNAPDEIVDQTKIDDTIKLIRKSDMPLFIHIHLMGTHGETFRPKYRVFSQGQVMKTQGSWNTDFYDDSILNFDTQVGEIVDALIKKDLFKNSIIIIGSDHGQKWTISKKIPLIIHFPQGEYSGRVEVNAQNIDIAPTILDYLGIDIPTWMQGQSLISDNLSQRPIYGIKTNTASKDETGNFYVVEIPLFHQFGKINLIYCQNWYSIDLQSYHFESGEVEGYVAPCRKEDLMSDADAFRLMSNHLKENGFNTSVLDEILNKKFAADQ